jgi:hypothetical protein
MPSRWYSVARTSFADSGRSTGVASVASVFPTTQQRATPLAKKLV